VWYASTTTIGLTEFTNFNSSLGSLNLDELERIVIDGSHIDQKQRGIFDMKETHLPLLQLLTRPELRDRYGASKKKVQILMF
jgi:protein CMS1